MRLSVVIPVHNDASILKQSVNSIYDYFSKNTIFQPAIFLIENGSMDESIDVIDSIRIERSNIANINIHAKTGIKKGLGHAYQAGTELALSEYEGQNHWIMLTASDLPFDFSDLDAFTEVSAGGTKREIYIGSKGHPDSKLKRSFLRKLSSVVFFLLRRCILGMKTKDTQGVVFLKAELAAGLISKINSRDYFYSTELIYYAEKNNIEVFELPVVYIGEKRPTNINIFRDSLAMFLNLLVLWKREIAHKIMARN